ncbi:DUF3889 domain-containing protein [Cytobacillus sp. IB215316]|uniref:DUF3889 domain-containing protein n=1 Tax=Cytobacillus sp. IB215316 TaxID=3097354 RepID=UPI002A16C46B|nr:DUF3889 domain-containing protein [Cytobacillus sp. IB215316]MDX8363463.1 DUF3889 domain-containing protein [Cytobacillus sp. IB215316]
MRKIPSITMLSLLIITECLLLLKFVVIPFSSVQADKEIQSYEKWGELALEKAQEKYPNSRIIDYLHIGRENLDNASVEKFKLWLNTNNVEFGVYVDIMFDNRTNQIIKINIKETPN